MHHGLSVKPKLLNPYFKVRTHATNQEENQDKVNSSV
jgi:hypothetical protein